METAKWTFGGRGGRSVERIIAMHWKRIKNRVACPSWNLNSDSSADSFNWKLHIPAHSCKFLGYPNSYSVFLWKDCYHILLQAIRQSIQVRSCLSSLGCRSYHSSALTDLQFLLLWFFQFVEIFFCFGAFGNQICFSGFSIPDGRGRGFSSIFFAQFLEKNSGLGCYASVLTTS